jgi:predicted amidohydrolase YtcJ
MSLPKTPVNQEESLQDIVIYLRMGLDGVMNIFRHVLEHIQLLNPASLERVDLMLMRTAYIPNTMLSWHGYSSETLLCCR